MLENIVLIVYAVGVARALSLAVDAIADILTGSKSENQKVKEVSKKIQSSKQNPSSQDIVNNNQEEIQNQEYRHLRVKSQIFPDETEFVKETQLIEQLKSQQNNIPIVQQVIKNKQSHQKQQIKNKQYNQQIQIKNHYQQQKIIQNKQFSKQQLVKNQQYHQQQQQIIYNQLSPQQQFKRNQQYHQQQVFAYKQYQQVTNQQNYLREQNIKKQEQYLKIIEKLEQENKKLENQKKIYNEQIIKLVSQIPIQDEEIKSKITMQNNNNIELLKYGIKSIINLSTTSKIIQQPIKEINNQKDIIISNLQEKIIKLNEQFKQKITQINPKLKQNKIISKSFSEIIINQPIQIINQKQNTIVNNISQNIKNQKQQQLQNQLQFCQNQLKQAANTQIDLRKQIAKLTKKNVFQNTRKSLTNQSKSTFKKEKVTFLQKNIQKTTQQIQESNKLDNQCRNTFSPVVKTEIEKDSHRISSTPLGRQTYKSGSPSPRRIVDVTVYSDLFPECDFLTANQKFFIFEQIRKLKKLIIKKSALLFQYQPNQKDTPNKVINNQPNVVVIAYLANGDIFGGFSQCAFSFQMKQILTYMKKGIIMNITKQKAFTNKLGTNPTTLTNQLLIWGNDEIKISNQVPPKIYCNFGQSNDNIYWDSQNPIQQFLPAYQEIKKYQIHRIYFS